MLDAGTSCLVGHSVAAYPQKRDDNLILGWDSLFQGLEVTYRFTRSWMLPSSSTEGASVVLPLPLSLAAGYLLNSCRIGAVPAHSSH
jgi:hypothetical protein